MGCGRLRPELPRDTGLPFMAQVALALPVLKQLDAPCLTLHTVVLSDVKAAARLELDSSNRDLAGWGCGGEAYGRAA